MNRDNPLNIIITILLKEYHLNDETKILIEIKRNTKYKQVDGLFLIIRSKTRNNLTSELWLCMFNLSPKIN